MKDKTELENLVVLKTPTKANISSSQAKGRGARGYMKDYKLKITGCNDPLKWYSDKIGDYVEFYGDTGTEYRSREDGGYTNFVQYDDCEVVHISEIQKGDS